MSTETPTTRTAGVALATTGTLTHAAQLVALLVLYISYVPRAKRTFDEFGLTLPWLTQTVIKLSNWVCEYWWALVPVMLFLGAVEFVLIALLRVRSSTAALVLIVGVALVLLVPAAVAVFAVELPMMKLREGLAR